MADPEQPEVRAELEREAAQEKRKPPKRDPKKDRGADDLLRDGDLKRTPPERPH